MAARPCDGEVSLLPSRSSTSVMSSRQGPNRLPYSEIYHLGLASQPNIYCCSKVDAVGNAKEKVLVGSLGGKVSCVDCSSPRGTSTYQPHSNEVYFNYIPGDAEIVSLDAFVTDSKDATSNKCSLVVGISLVLLKNPNSYSGVQLQKHFLNVYSSVKPETTPTIESVAGICQHIELDFTPYQLTHARIDDDNGADTVFLLSGSDKKVHMFAEDNDLQKFVERDVEGYFPEFVNLRSCVTWIDMHRCHDNLRATAMACENGCVRYCVVDERNSAVISMQEIDIDGPALSVKLFPFEGSTFNPSELKSMDLDTMKTWQNDPLPCYCPSLNLLVTSALDLSVVFRSPKEAGFSDMLVLPQSDHHDSVTCSLISDVDCDGNNEIILGTYGQELLVYKWRREFDDIHFDLIWQCSFSQPIFALNQLDLLGDGMTELVVATTTSVHIMQRDVASSVSMLLDKLIGIASHQGRVTEHQAESAS